MGFVISLLAPIGIVFVFSCLFVLIGLIISKDIFVEKDNY